MAVGRRHHRLSSSSHGPSARPEQCEAESKDDAITRQQYEDLRFAREFRRQRGDRPRPYEQRLLRQLLAAARARRHTHRLNGRRALLVLDLGTGYGRDLAWLQGQPGVRAVGVDYALTMLRLARGELPLVRGTLVQMDARALGFKSASVDVIRAQALFHHLLPRAADRAMREVARALKPGGLLQVFVRPGRRQGMLSEPGLGARYFRYFTLTTLRALLRRHGLYLLGHEAVMAHPRLPCLAALAEKPL